MQNGIIHCNGIKWPREVKLVTTPWKQNKKNYYPRLCGVVVVTRWLWHRDLKRGLCSTDKCARKKLEAVRETGSEDNNLLNPVLLHLKKTAERGYVDISGCTANVWDRLDVSTTIEPLIRTENPSRTSLPRREWSSLFWCCSSSEACGHAHRKANRMREDQ